MSRHRYNPERGRVDPRDLPRGPQGRALCRHCGAEVPPRRRTFCSEGCVHEWKLRSQATYLRRQVFARDHGRCAACGLVVPAVKKRLDKLRRECGESTWMVRLKRLGFWDCRDRTWWEVHHIKPVAEGGGMCSLTNVCTLCVPCHRRTTRRVRKRQGSRS
ncbi:MAG: HNH endonuclease [Armatimonadetes bacterium]|nr:HNH endonuclease [Armatimonadota bacterium]